MSLFHTNASQARPIFKNEDALDFEFLPKSIPYREGQQKAIAAAIQPMLQGHNGRNVLIHGQPGIGKTAAIRWVLKDLEEMSDDVYPIYINCWQKNTTFQIFSEICDQLSYKFTQNKRTDELFNIIKNIVNKKAAVFVFDEIDKVSDYDFLYSLLEEIYKRSVMLITNFKEWVADMDIRIKSRLMPSTVEFLAYNRAETEGILKQRCEYAFVPDAWEKEALSLIVDKTSVMKDVRSGLYMVREAGLTAELENKPKIDKECAKIAVEKSDQLQVKKTSELDNESRLILKTIQKNSGQKIGDLFKKFKTAGGNGSYKTFQRKVDRLVIGAFITANKVVGGATGTTTILSVKGGSLSDY